jgi:thioredoxin:protein disulfide reductase
MDARRLAGMALAVGLAVAVLPSLLPTGPTAGLDAAGLLRSGSFAVGAAVVFAGGLLTALTPCVYPLIPITVSVFGARKAEGRARSLALTGAYIVGMGLVFSALGVLAAKTGQAFGSLLGHPLAVGGLALFLLLLASSMFGAFELELPPRLQERLSGVGGSGVVGALLMGSVSGFLAAPCTGPVLTGLLAFVAQSQSTALGAGLLFVYALGIGVPFFILGVFTVSLPRGGVWMEWVKSLLGIVLVALAATYLKDALPPAREAAHALSAQLGRVPGALLAALLAALGVALGAVHLSFKAGARPFLLKALGVLLVAGALLVRTAALDAPSAGSLWVRLGWAEPPAAPTFQWHAVIPARAAEFRREDFDAVLSRARSEGRPVMVDFYADWCAACKELDRHTYPAPEVIAASSRFVNLKVDATNGSDAMDALFEHYGIQGLPTVLFFSSQGEVLQAPRVLGFLPPPLFASELQKVQ